MCSKAACSQSCVNIPTLSPYMLGPLHIYIIYTGSAHDQPKSNPIMLLPGIIVNDVNFNHITIISQCSSRKLPL